MKIQTKYHGDIDIEEKDIIFFEKGIPGFPDEKQFILLALPDQALFSIMQSVETSGLAFVLTCPFNYIENYEFTLDDNTLEQLSIKNQEEISVFTIVTVQEPFEKTTANLQAPIVLNGKNNKAKQVIVNNSPYKIKHPIFPKAEKG